MHKANALFYLEKYEQVPSLVQRWHELMRVVSTRGDLVDVSFRKSAYIIAAASHRHLGNPEAELEVWRDAVREYPEDAAFWHQLGHACTQAGLHEEAAAASLKSFVIDSTNDEVLSNIMVYSQAPLVDLGLQLELLYVVVEAHPEDSTTLNSLAWLMALDPEAYYFDPEGAIGFASRGIRLVPEDANMWNTLGLALVRAQRWDDAIEAVEEAIALSSTEGDAYDWCFLAMARYGKGDAAGARECYERARSFEPVDDEDEDLEQIDREVRTLLGIE
jgi:tetratricopeptide (TPR) repeat protein